MASLNYIKVARVEKTIFVPLPASLWRRIDGGCCCPYCSDARGKMIPAYWDTLAIAATGDDGRNVAGDTTWTVHNPALQGFPRLRNE